MFKIDNDIKEEYLKTKPSATAQSNRFILEEVDDYENLSNKEVYNMSHSELREMIATRFKNSSENTVLKNVSIIRTYIDFCLEKRIVLHGENRLATFNRKESRAYISKLALDYKYITPEEKDEYIKKLENPQDKGLFESFYIGIRGRTDIEGTLEELINLEIDENSEEWKNNYLTLTRNNGDKRTIYLSNYSKNILLAAKNQGSYVGNNGVELENIRGGIRNTTILPLGNYVFRVPNKSVCNLFNSVLVNSRIRRFQEWLGNKYITVHSLYMSGMITKALEIYREKGEITNTDYDDICNQYGYRVDDQYRWMALRDVVTLYIKK